ncbi:hypothetical protein MPLSOD_310097 [Mesorhizobium sp. SOD10]|nr:hypothetical protein MPLSOD_310097 [Mesorhizobium sp. SOD10]
MAHALRSPERIPDLAAGAKIARQFQSLSAARLADAGPRIIAQGETFHAHRRGEPVMVEKRLDCAVGVAIQRALGDDAVLAKIVASRPRRVLRDQAVARGLIGKLIAEADQPLRPACRDQCAMKGAVQLFPLRIVGCRVIRQPALGARKAVQGEHQLLFPFGGAVRNGFAQRPLLQPAARARQFLQFRGADRHQEETTLVVTAEQALGGQPVECLAHRRRAGAIAGNDPFDPQFRLGLQSAAQQVVAQLLVDRTGKRAFPALAFARLGVSVCQSNSCCLPLVCQGPSAKQFPANILYSRATAPQAEDEIFDFKTTRLFIEQSRISAKSRYFCTASLY